MSGHRAVSRQLAALVVLSVLTVAPTSGCGLMPNSPTASPSTSADIGSIVVAGASGTKPTVSLPTPFSVDRTDRRVLTVGTGPVVKAGQRVTIQYVGFNGTDGKEFNSSYSRGSASFVLDAANNIKGLIDGLVASTVGSRLLLAIPPQDAYGLDGMPSLGIGPTDTIVIVVDVVAAKDVLTRATGTPVAPKAGLPTVRLDAVGRPTIKVPASAPPASLVVQPLITGRGAKVLSGQKITVRYSGVIWPGGRQFDSSWAAKTPAAFVIGRGRVLTGWDEGLVGQPVGSQILLVIPPDEGYGAVGNPAAGIKGTDTLVFVVDILDAA